MELKLLNMFALLTYIVGGLILNNEFVFAQAAEPKFTEVIDQNPNLREHTYEKINCICEDMNLCNIKNECGDIYIEFRTVTQKLVVVCPIETNVDINLINDSDYLKATNCENIYSTDNGAQMGLYARQVNKLTLINYLNRHDFFYLFLLGNLLQLHIITKTAEDIDMIPDILDDHINILKALKLNVQIPENKRIMLRKFAQKYFPNLHQLRQLDLAENNLQTLDEDLFVKLTKLSSLNLSSNGIIELPPKLFAKQRQLVILDLSYNSLEYLPPELFQETLFLWQLNLNSNSLHDPANLITTLKPLHYVHGLDFNVKKQHNFCLNELFEKIQNDNTLGLKRHRHNNFKLQPKKYGAKYKFNITVIDLSHNLLREFNLDWLVKAGITRAFRINLAHNSIKSIYALTNFPDTTESFVREIQMAGNPVECDCKLAWIFNANYRAIFTDLQCKPNSKGLLIELSSVQRNELCPWQSLLCPTSCDCYTQPEWLTINCAGRQLAFIEQLPRPEQVDRTNTVLDISGNWLSALPPNTTMGYANVTQLNASSNRITDLSHFQLPANLTVLDLRRNLLNSLSADVLRALLNDSAQLQYVYLSENRWRCDCDAQHLLYTVRAQRSRIPDVELLDCVNQPNVTLLTANVDDLCQAVVNVELLKFVTTVAVVIIVVLLLIALFYKYKLEVKVWLYGRNILTSCIQESELDKNKKFDAFISYAHQDADFVNHTLLPRLEQSEDPPFRICTHERNWLPGAYIPEQIIESVDQSRRTIIVLSQHFIESDWARMEFRTAHQRSLNEGRARIIIVKYGEITNTELLDKELRAYLQMNTYLDWQDARFWDKLRYAMPHKETGRARDTDMLEVNGRAYVMGQVEMNRLCGQSS